ncbi:MAG: ABC transporter ATP-binding protein, partial [Burkholderiales bacterium]
MLELRQISRHFGGVRAVDGLDLTVREGEIFGLIGPNGSGKSTAVNLVAGLFPLTSGRIFFRDNDLEKLPMHKRLQLGIARTFQSIRLFGQLTVWQNLWVAQNSPEDRARRGFLARWLGGQKGVRAEIAQLLEFSGLAQKQDELAANLSFGEQRRLELARALATKPKLLLLDEPAAGMNSEEIGQLKDRILRLRSRGITVVLVEHVMELVMGVTDRIAVLNFGQKIAEGTPAEIQADP